MMATDEGWGQPGWARGWVRRRTIDQILHIASDATELEHRLSSFSREERDAVLRICSKMRDAWEQATK